MANITKNLSFLFFTLIFIISVAGNQIYTPSDNIAISCGDHGDQVALDGRKWTGDESSKYLSSQGLNSSSTSIAFSQDFAPQIPYMTARVFRSQFTYSFNFSTLGPTFVRLHFHPSSYSTTHVSVSESYFTVTLNDFTVLRNFSTSLAARDLNTTYFVKEFYVNMVSEPVLNIKFTPSSGTYAFINGIEVVSAPSNLYTHSDTSIMIVGQSQKYTISNYTAFETVYRLNVGAKMINPEDDTGMFRTWSEDVDYIYGAYYGQEPYNFKVNMTYTMVPPYTAPEILYRTARSMGSNRALNEISNLTWFFPVDSGFFYLVRLHFCEIAPEIMAINQRVFQIFLNNKTADDQMDIMVYADREKIGVPIYRDFIVIVPGSGSKKDIWLALHPNTKARAAYSDALLNGLEIFKLNKSDGSLAGLNPEIPDPIPDNVVPAIKQHGHFNKIRTSLITVGVVIGGAIALFVLFYFSNRRQKKYSSSTSRRPSREDPYSKSGPDTKRTKSLPSDICRHFSLAEIKFSTRDFNEALVIGSGGFGNVYKGYIDDDSVRIRNTIGSTPVAIKRLNASSQQGAHEFHTEIETLSQLRHLHLVSLIGYCVEDDEMILVYDYMTRGTLREHLYNTNNPPLPWKLRLQICIGAAQGLHYLHTGAKNVIIHRDVKTTNILLDEKWTAKVSDFGLSKVGPTSMSQTHISTVVKGSFGYLDPEYYRRQQLTEKSDVYSFGVVLFEVLCARPPVDRTQEKGEICLCDLARKRYRKGKLDQLIDPFLRGKIAPECLKKFAEVADNCLKDEGIERPPMNDVVWNLEFALKLQESCEESRADNDGDNEENSFRQSFVSLETSSNTTVNSRTNSTLGSSSGVFSEIINPTAR